MTAALKLRWSFYIYTCQLGDRATKEEYIPFIGVRIEPASLCKGEHLFIKALILHTDDALSVSDPSERASTRLRISCCFLYASACISMTAGIILVALIYSDTFSRSNILLDSLLA
jgi:hypothetical protein